MSNLRYMCFLSHSGVQHILCFTFGVFVCVCCAICCQFVWIVHIWLPLRFFLKLISSVNNALCILFLWIVHYWLSPWFSLTCIYSIYTVIYFANHNILLSDFLFAHTFLIDNFKLHNVVELIQILLYWELLAWAGTHNVSGDRHWLHG